MDQSGGVWEGEGVHFCIDQQISWFFVTSLLLKQNLPGARIQQADGRKGLCWLELAGAWEPQWLGPHVSLVLRCLESLRNSELCRAAPENCCTSWPRRALPTWKMMLFYEDAQTVTPTDPHLLPTFIEMEQPGRIQSHPGELSFEVTNSSPTITMEKKNWAWKRLYFVMGLLLPPPGDNDLHCLLHSSWGGWGVGGIHVNCKGATLEFKEFLEDWSMWKFSTLVSNPVNYHLI